MNINNNPRIIVVTGASQGIGYSICETYLRNGDIVIGCACESANKNITFLLRKLIQIVSIIIRSMYLKK
ncbi:SDR family NAD(P)-dependent oxidoreductase, partial [Providencia vermicola]